MIRLNKALLLGLAIGLTGSIVSFTPFGLMLEENIGLDQLFMFRGQRSAPTDVVIISIDKESARDLNLAKEPVKWPRTLHAKLIDRLAARGARVIGFDVLFKEQRTTSENELLSKSMKKANNVVLFQYLDKQVIPMTGQSIISDDQTIVETLVPPIPVLAEAAIALAPFALPKVPAKVSQIWMFKPSAGDVATLPAVMFQVYAFQVYDDFRRLLIKTDESAAPLLPPDKETIITARNTQKILTGLRNFFFSKPTISQQLIDEINRAELDETRKTLLRALVKLYTGPNSQYLNYYGPARSLTTIPFSKIIQLSQKVNTDNPVYDFTGKAIFVGLSEPIQLERVDTFYTPFSQENGVDISGIEIGATAFANLLEDNVVQPLDAYTLLLLLFAWGLLMGLIGHLLPAAYSIVGYIVIGIVYYISCFYLFEVSSRWLPTIVPLFLQLPIAIFVSILWRYIDTNKERKKIRDAFGYFLPDNIVDDMATNLLLGQASHQLNIGTVLATDAEKYTNLSEKLTPRALGELMNQYYEILFLPVKQHNGIVSDIIGDAMMAIWTSPQSDLDHRQHACRAAIDMMNGVNEFNQSTTHEKLPTRIGLDSGEILLGNIGAVNHYEYRAVGDTVNTASRIEGLNKHLGTHLLVSESVIDGLDDFLTRKLGKFLLVGKRNPIVIYELVNSQSSASVKQKSLCKDFAVALSEYQDQSWSIAADKFNQIILKYQHDGPSEYYLTLCNQNKNIPLTSSWNEVIIINNK